MILFIIWIALFCTLHPPTIIGLLIDGLGNYSSCCYSSCYSSYCIFVSFVVFPHLANHVHNRFCISLGLKQNGYAKTLIWRLGRLGRYPRIFELLLTAISFVQFHSYIHPVLHSYLRTDTPISLIFFSIEIPQMLFVLLLSF